MEWAGWFCLIILIMYSSYPSKVKRLECKVRALENKQKGDFSMSKLISELIGQRCKITNEDGSQNAWVYTILDVDDEWVKAQYANKKGVSNTVLIRIDAIKKVDLILEP